jgi:hypothetical protein
VRLGADELVVDLVSGDPPRVLSAAHAVVRTRDTDLLDALVVQLPELRRRTTGLVLGGALFPNDEHLAQALRLLGARRDGSCRCTTFPAYLFHDPAREQEAGQVLVTRTDEPGWNMTYDCTCLECGRTWAVEQGESHYSWWQWRPRVAP